MTISCGCFLLAEWDATTCTCIQRVRSRRVTSGYQHISFPTLQGPAPSFASENGASQRRTRAVFRETKLGRRAFPTRHVLQGL
jgi:hypothetical protein